MQQKHQLSTLIHAALSELGVQPLPEVTQITQQIEVPKDSSMGDLAFPCFTLAKAMRQAPQKISASVAQAVERLIGASGEGTPFTKAVATGPYVNLFFDIARLAADVVSTISSGEFLARRQSNGKRVMVEYSQPNTHKAFHVGHVRCASMGDALSRMFDWSGYETIPVNYIGDEGAHVAKCLWYYINHRESDAPEMNRGEYLGQLYVKATEMLDLGTLTRAPYPGVKAVVVKKITQHPVRAELSVVDIESEQGAQVVVTGAKGFKEGDLVAYALSGVKVVGRTVGEVEVAGVKSVGMLCSENEIGLSESGDMAVLPAGVAVGSEVAEIYRYETGAESVLAQMRRREQEVGEVLRKLESGDAQMKQIWEETRRWSMEELYTIYDWLNCRFDRYFYESECTEMSRAIVDEYLAKGVFKESEGAIGVDLSVDKLGFCLLRKRDGNILYATRDLALARMKFDEYKIDRSVYVVDTAQTLHFQQVFKVLELMGYQQSKDCFHLSYAQVVTPDGKMSSRKGNVILFSQLQERLLSRINGEYLDRYKDEWPEEELREAARAIALATMRYGMLNPENNTEICFDLNEWTAKSGNTGPYILYAYARIASMLREAVAQGVWSPDGGAVADRGATQRSEWKIDWSLIGHESEAEVLRHLNGYHEMVERAVQYYAPNIICAYLYELCKRFSRMYQSCSVLRAENDELKRARLELVKAVGQVIKHGLGLLGIVTLERM